jgi:hypothetical protein
METIRQLIGWLVFNWTPEAITAAATVSIAFLTLFLGVGTFLLSGATRQLVRGSEKTAERQLRAYMGIQNGRAILVANDNQISVNINFRNSGQTPAYRVRIRTMANLLGSDLEPPFTDDNDPIPFNDRIPNSIISPGAPSSTSWVLKLESRDLESIQFGAAVIYVWGRIDYLDAFKQDRWFIFRCAMNGVESDLIDVATGQSAGRGWGLRPHALGYEAN